MADRRYNVLFLCTGNSARSILAEAILNKVGGARFRAFSAGSQPKGEVNPFAIRLLEKSGYDTSFARSKSWDEFAEEGAPADGFRVHGLRRRGGRDMPGVAGAADDGALGRAGPGGHRGTDAEKAIAFGEAFRQLSSRIGIFVNLPVESLDRLSLQKKLDEIGKAKTGAGA